MNSKDHHDHTLSGATAAAVEPFECAQAMLRCYIGDPVTEITKVPAERQQPKAANSRCRPTADLRIKDLASGEPSINGRRLILEVNDNGLPPGNNAVPQLILLR